MRRSVFFAFVGLMIGFVAGFWIARVTTSRLAIAPLTPAGSAASGATVDIDTRGRPARGPKHAPVTVVEFTDYQCPFCGKHFRTVYPQLLAAYRGKIRYVVFNFPVTNLHPFAEKAAEAADCAEDQGKFWAYHDALFRHQAALDVPSLKRYAADAGLDAAKFATCVDSGSKAAAVTKDVDAAQAYGVTGTPTFFVNGVRYLGATTYDIFRSRIDQALVKSRRKP